MFIGFQKQFTCLEEIQSTLQTWQNWIHEYSLLTKKKRIYLPDLQQIANHLIHGRFHLDLPIDHLLESFLQQTDSILLQKNDLGPYIYSSSWYDILQKWKQEDQSLNQTIQPFLPSYFLFQHLLSSLPNPPQSSDEYSNLWSNLMKHYLDNPQAQPNSLSH